MSIWHYPGCNPNVLYQLPLSPSNDQKHYKIGSQITRTDEVKTKPLSLRFAICRPIKVRIQVNIYNCRLLFSALFTVFRLKRKGATTANNNNRQQQQQQQQI